MSIYTFVRHVHMNIFTTVLSCMCLSLFTTYQTYTRIHTRRMTGRKDGNHQPSDGYAVASRMRIST